MSMKYSCDESCRLDVLVLAAFDMFSVEVGVKTLAWPFSVVRVFFFFLLRCFFFPSSEGAELGGTATSWSEVRSTKF